MATTQGVWHMLTRQNKIVFFTDLFNQVVVQTKYWLAFY